jgi:hypothetical protein
MNAVFSKVFLFVCLFVFINLAGQLSQSAHLALQLPYNVLGLGRSANFLDHLFVGIPRPSGEKASKHLVCLQSVLTPLKHLSLVI